MEGSGNESSRLSRGYKKVRPFQGKRKILYESSFIKVFFLVGNTLLSIQRMAQGNEGRLYCMKFCKVDFMQQGPGFQPNSQGTI